jgi:hypothetical protein
VLNTQSVSNGVMAVVDNANSVPIDVMLKRDNRYTFVFAASMQAARMQLLQFTVSLATKQTELRASRTPARILPGEVLLPIPFP